MENRHKMTELCCVWVSIWCWIWGFFSTLNQNLLSSIIMNKDNSIFCHPGWAGRAPLVGHGSPFPPLSDGVSPPQSSEDWWAFCPFITWTHHDEVAAALALGTMANLGWYGLMATTHARLVAVVTFAQVVQRKFLEGQLRFLGLSRGKRGRHNILTRRTGVSKAFKNKSRLG